MIMLSAFSCVCFLHHAHFTCYVALCLLSLYCIMPSLFVLPCLSLVILLLVIHVVSMSIMCIALILMLHVTFMLWVHQPLLSLSQAMPMYHHLSLPPSFMFLQVTLFPPPLMFVYFLAILLNALYLYVKFYLIWSGFGWVQKWLKFEFNSHLNYFSILKNAQSNLSKFCTNSGLQIYSHISLMPSLYL